MIFSNINAQNFDIPPNYSFQYAEDYKTYETDIFKCIDWLQQTPVNVNIEKRQEAHEFLFQWIAGTSSVDLKLNIAIMNLVEKNPELLYIYMGRCIKHDYENPDKATTKDSEIAGLTSIVEYYKGKNSLVPDKKIETLTKAFDKGQLKEWMNKNWK